MFLLTLAGHPAATASPPTPEGATAEPVAYADLSNWADDAHELAFSTFVASCALPFPLREALPRPAFLQDVCTAALALKETGPVGRTAARAFFERHFDAYHIRPGTGAGFMTGYFEPEFPGSLQERAGYPTPVYGRPLDLVTRTSADHWPQVDPGLSSARLTAQGVVPFPDRAAIDDGALKAQGLEIIWLKDPVDRFVIQVQGSARIRLDNGRTVRLAYAGRNGHPYTSLGRVLSEEEGIEPAQMTMDRLVARLKSDLAKGQALIRRNRSFVFFRIANELAESSGPIGGAGVPLTPHRSIAADRTTWPYGLPVWLKGELPQQAGPDSSLARLTVIQDTGSAILGPARLDLYFGSGPQAGDLAGRLRHRVEFTVLWPRSAPRP